MLQLFVVMASLIGAASVGDAGHQDAFAQSYGVFVSVDQKVCIYWLTDVGLSASQLKDALSDGYETSRGLEILTEKNTPARCVASAHDAALRAGFVKVRARLATAKDRMPGIP